MQKTMSPPRSAPSLQVQLALAFGLLVLALSAFLSLGLGAMLYRQIEREQGDELRTASKNAALVLVDDLRKNARSAQVLAASPSLWSAGLDAPPVAAVLARAQAINPDMTWIGVADESGIVRAATGGLLVGESVQARPWFKPGQRGLYVGDVHEAKLLASRLPAMPDGEPRRFVDFSAPIVSSGRRVGVLAIHGGWEWADAVVQKLAPEGAAELGIETFVFDRSGRLIYAHGSKLRALASAGQTLPPEAAASAAEVAWRDGGSYLTASFRMPEIAPSIDLGWTVVTRQPEGIAFAAARGAERAALALGAAAAALSVALAWALARRLALPLKTIDRAARLVAAGSASAIPPQRGSREVEELSRSLGAMTERLISSNRELERRVAERTEELTRANAELSRLARRDPLTGLLNRRGFEEQAGFALSAARRSGAAMSVVAVDADHFKRVNDELGHAAGDQALRAIADAAREALRESDIVARVGGEEFAALLSGCDGDGALVAAEKICAAMRALSIPGIGVVTVSCGAAELAPLASDLVDGLARADLALYEAKRSGRDRAILLGPSVAAPALSAATA